MKIIKTKQNQEVQIVSSTDCIECMFESKCDGSSNDFEIAKMFEKENSLPDCSENGGVKYLLLES